MSGAGFDLDAWFDRIGHAGSRDPTLATLNAVVLAHCTAIPYENIEVFTGGTPKLDIDSLQRKMVRDRRGGYCYEQNLLMRDGLRAMGFDATGMIGRVVRGFQPDAPRMAGHMAIRVSLPQGRFLVDVGFGNLSPTCPLELRTGVVQATPHEPMRFMPVGGELVLQVKLAGEWDSLYRLCSYLPLDIDYQVANWFVATYPGGVFLNNLIAARPGSNGERYTFLNGRVNVRHADGSVERRLLGDDGDFGIVLTEMFGLSLPGYLARHCRRWRVRAHERPNTSSSANAAARRSFVHPSGVSWPLVRRMRRRIEMGRAGRGKIVAIME